MCDSIFDFMLCNLISCVITFLFVQGLNIIGGLTVNIEYVSAIPEVRNLWLLLVCFICP